MTIVYAAGQAQADAILDLVRWFDTESTSLYHALIMAAQRNEADAASIEADSPVGAVILRQSATAWRKHATRVLELSEKLGDTETIDANPF